ncbi:MAG: Rho termination factor N-terminal domain-containing protein, partial [Rhodothermales bacterium]
MKIADLQAKKLAELKDIARSLNLAGFSALRKQDLIYLILEAQAEAVAGNGSKASHKARTGPKKSPAAHAGAEGKAQPEKPLRDSVPARSAAPKPPKPSRESPAKDTPAQTPKPDRAKPARDAKARSHKHPNRKASTDRP